MKNHDRSKAVQTEQRICSKCGKAKPLSEFYKTSRQYTSPNSFLKTYHYLRSECRECKSKIRKEYYKRKGH